MRKTSPRGVIGAFSFAFFVGLVLGCGKKDEPQPAPNTGPVVVNPPGGVGQTPDKEDPQVLDYFKQKGWKLHTDTRFSDGRRFVFLTVSDPKKQFDKIAITPEDYKAIAKSKTLQVLDFNSVNCTDEGLATIATIPQMESILVQGEQVTDAGMKALAQAKSLEIVTLAGTKKVTDAGVKELAALPKLTMLYLTFFELDGSAFEAFAGAKSLTFLGLDFMDGLTDEGAKHIAKIPNLTELKIKPGFGEKKLTTAGLKAIAAVRVPPKFEFDMKLLDDDLLATLIAKGWFPTPIASYGQKPPAKLEEVRVLTLDDSKVTDKGFAGLLKCTDVTLLSLRNTGITDETLKKLGTFKNLNYLSLEKTKVTAAGVETVAGLPLKHLAMQGCELSEDSFKAFGKMKGLEELWLSDAKMQPDWLKHLAGLPKLKDLNLMGAAFDDAAAKHVATLPELKSLTLNNTNLGDAGFQELVKLPKLESLLVDGTKVTKEVYQKAKKDRPKLYLFFYRYDS